MKITPQLCIKCKGKLLCGLKACPILQKRSSQTKLVSKIKNNSFDGATPPAFFVSWKNYPKVSVAPLSSLPQELSPISDSPEDWYGLPAEKIIGFRESLLRSYKTMPVNVAANPNYEVQDFQELVMSKNILDVNISLNKLPKKQMSFDSLTSPVGLSAELNKLKFDSNPKIEKKLDHFYSDTDAKSNTALIELYESGFNVSTLSKVLSAGVIGQKKNRKLVPTRWSITAVDSNLSKYFIEEKIIGNKIIDCFKLFNSNYLDNNFWILLLPYPFSFENIECWLGGGVWNFEEKEFKIISDCQLTPVSSYPTQTQGAFFAARFSVCEYLKEKKLNASAIVFREIGQDYSLPLGVWQIRENVRAAMSKKPFDFSSLDLVFEFLSTKLSVPINNYKNKSILLNHLKTQTRISQWF